MNDPTIQLLSEEEGRVPHAYQDSRGFWTIGVGHLIDKKAGGKLSDECIDTILAGDVRVAKQAAQELIGPTWDALGDIRQAVITSMVFQMGAGEMDRWVTFIELVQKGQFQTAAYNGLATAWARQVPARAKRQMAMLVSGEWVDKE